MTEKTKRSGHGDHDTHSTAATTAVQRGRQCCAPAKRECKAPTFWHLPKSDFSRELQCVVRFRHQDEQCE